MATDEQRIGAVAVEVPYTEASQQWVGNVIVEVPYLEADGIRASGTWVEFAYYDDVRVGGLVAEIAAQPDPLAAVGAVIAEVAYVPWEDAAHVAGLIVEVAYPAKVIVETTTPGLTVAPQAVDPRMSLVASTLELLISAVGVTTAQQKTLTTLELTVAPVAVTAKCVVIVGTPNLTATAWGVGIYNQVPVYTPNLTVGAVGVQAVLVVTVGTPNITISITPYNSVWMIFLEDDPPGLIVTPEAISTTGKLSLGTGNMTITPVSVTARILMFRKFPIHVTGRIYQSQLAKRKFPKIH